MSRYRKRSCGCGRAAELGCFQLACQAGQHGRSTLTGDRGDGGHRRQLHHGASQPAGGPGGAAHRQDQPPPGRRSARWSTTSGKLAPLSTGGASPPSSSSGRTTPALCLGPTPSKGCAWRLTPPTASWFPPPPLGLSALPPPPSPHPPARAILNPCAHRKPPNTLGVARPLAAKTPASIPPTLPPKPIRFSPPPKFGSILALYLT